MAAAFAFLGIFLTSLLVAELATLSLGDFFAADDEFVLVLVAVAAFATTFTTAVFAICYATVQRARALNGIALLLALLAIMLVAVPGVVARIAAFSSNPFAAGEEGIPIAVELLVPALLAVLTQWGLVRRRYLQMAGEDDLTRWPWVTTAIAAFVLLNRYGLEFIVASFKQTDIMWPFMSAVTVGSVGALVVMAGIECYIRGRILRRRKGPNPPAASLQAGAHRA